MENIKSCRLHRHRTYVFPEDVDDAEMMRLDDEEQQKQTSQPTPWVVQVVCALKYSGYQSES